MDVALKGYRDTNRVPGVNVSILVLLDVALKGWETGSDTYRGQVSILVLLDVALKVLAALLVPRSISSFNPCSLGCCSERSATSISDALSGGFNPCSLGCCSESLSAISTRR